MNTRKLLVVALLFAVGAVLVVLSGIIPIEASSGHWRMTSWVLDFTKRRSVATHSIVIETPALDGQALVLKGAGHYETACRQCHGSPLMATPLIPQRMTPNPPDLRPQLARWKPRELFYIVKHGIKFTGMPAWSTRERDDEVWAVVAFLQVLPQMDADEYAWLVFGDRPPSGEESQADGSATSPQVLKVADAQCARCHGAAGQGRDLAAFPRLAGQRPEYLRRAMSAYARGSRHSGMMQPIAAGMDDAMIRALAEYYAALPASPGTARDSSGARDPSAARGEDIALRGIPAQRVPRCAECHGPAASDRNAAYPSLAGQFPDYLVLQLRLFADGRRGGSEYTHLMSRVAGRLTVEQTRDVAQYYASLPR